MSFTKAGTLAVAMLLLAGCGQQVDLYDYFGDGGSSAPKPARVSQPPVPPSGAEPANAALGGSPFDGSDDALAAARPSSGIERVSLKNAQGVAVTVDDLPVTNFDISQRINLENALGGRYEADFATRKRILGTMVNERVAEAKARQLNYSIPDSDLEDRINKMVGRMKISRDALKQKLAEKGVNEDTLKAQLKGSLYIRWVMAQQQVDTDIKVDQAKVDAKLQEIANDPRSQAINVISVRQVDLPVEKTSEAMHQQLLYARAIEAQQIMENYKGCSSLKSASRGIFNVKIGSAIEADMSKLPPDMKKALLEAGTRRLIGPVPSPTGVRLFANCGTRKISPPLPSRQQIENAVRNEEFENLVQEAMAKARKDAYVDYKDPAFKP
jgi:hypothetical protein